MKPGNQVKTQVPNPAVVKPEDEPMHKLPHFRCSFFVVYHPVKAR